MDAFLTQRLERQRVVYEEAGRRLGLTAGSVEKDLWVCWTLRALFRLPASGPHLTFKGGTSLSKGWKLIDRFSEDIDIVIDRQFLGFGGADGPEDAPSNKQREKRLDGLKLATQHHIRDVLGPALEQEIRHLLPSTAPWTLEADADDPDAAVPLPAGHGSCCVRSASCEDRAWRPLRHRAVRYTGDRAVPHGRLPR